MSNNKSPLSKAILQIRSFIFVNSLSRKLLKFTEKKAANQNIYYKKPPTRTNKTKFISDITKNWLLLLIFTFIASFWISEKITANNASDNWEWWLAVIPLLFSVNDIAKGILEGHVEILLKTETPHKRQTSESHPEYEKRQFFFLSCLISDQPKFEVKDLSFADISPSICEKKNNTRGKLFEISLHREFERELKHREAIRIITSLPDEDFLKPLALRACIHALSANGPEDFCEPDDRYPLLKDIYAYLKAWVRCSLTNDSNQLMPISVIGLNYSKKSAYKIALEFIIEDLLEREEASDFLTTIESKELFQDCLNKLIDLIRHH